MESIIESFNDDELSDWSKLPSEPLVSVLMITYNHKKYFREAIDSVLMQKVDFPYEICLGEDGSTDGTREICLEYAAKYPDRIRLFLRNRQNKAREHYKVPFMHNGVETYKSCRGKYVALLEGDDYWISNRKLERQVKILESNPNLSVCSHYTIAVPENQPWRVFSFPFRYLHHFDLSYLLAECFFLATCSLVYRRIDITKRKEFSKAYAGDTLMTALHLEQGSGIILPETMAVYRKHSKGASAGGAGYDPASVNIQQWQLFYEMYSSGHRKAIDRGYAHTLCRSIIINRERHLWRKAISNTYRLYRQALFMKSTPIHVRIYMVTRGILGLLFPWSVKLLDWLSNKFINRNRSF